MSTSAAAEENISPCLAATHLMRVELGQHKTGGANTERCHESVDGPVHVMQGQDVKNDIP